VVSAPPPNTTYRLYYYANGQPIAMRVLPPNDATGTLYYLHQDHLGSTSLVTCGNSACGTVGSVVARQWYDPHGAVRGSVGTLPTKRTYTGQLADETGLYFYNARYYAPLIGRFISADTIVPEPGNPQALNRYAYSLSNPLKYIDPSGHASRPSCAGQPDCGVDDEDDNGSGFTPPPNPVSPIISGCTDSACRYDFYSVTAGVDVPTIVWGVGAVISLFAPEVGVPTVLTGKVLELCGYSNPVCYAIKATSLGGVATLDRYGNVYLGGDLAFGKALTPFVGASFVGGVISDSPFDPGAMGGPNFHKSTGATEQQTKGFLEGLAFSATALFAPSIGVAYSPFASDQQFASTFGFSTGLYSLDVSYSFNVGKIDFSWDYVPHFP
jgi:RHS repeat-associated protein